MSTFFLRQETLVGQPTDTGAVPVLCLLCAHVRAFVGACRTLRVCRRLRRSVGFRSCSRRPATALYWPVNSSQHRATAHRPLVATAAVVQMQPCTLGSLHQRPVQVQALSRAAAAAAAHQPASKRPAAVQLPTASHHASSPAAVLRPVTGSASGRPEDLHPRRALLLLLLLPQRRLLLVVAQRPPSHHPLQACKPSGQAPQQRRQQQRSHSHTQQRGQLLLCSLRMRASPGDRQRI
jgi:hypothetical protein